MKPLREYLPYWKNHPFQWKVFLVIAAFFVVSSLIVIGSMTYYGTDFDAKVDSAISNGLLTSLAIVFGFITYEIREIQLPVAKKFLLHVVLLALVFYSVASYFGNAIRFGYITNRTMGFITMTFLFTFLYSALIVILREHFELKTSKLA